MAPLRIVDQLLYLNWLVFQSFHSLEDFVSGSIVDYYHSW